MDIWIWWHRWTWEFKFQAQDCIPLGVNKRGINWGALCRMLKGPKYWGSPESRGARHPWSWCSSKFCCKVVQLWSTGKFCGGICTGSNPSTTRIDSKGNYWGETLGADLKYEVYQQASELKTVPNTRKNWMTSDVNLTPVTETPGEDPDPKVHAAKELTAAWIAVVLKSLKSCPNTLQHPVPMIIHPKSYPSRQGRCV
jgi:hypothetical protein